VNEAELVPLLLHQADDMPALGSLARTSFALALAALPACASLPPRRTAIDDVVVLGARRVDEDDVLERIATTPSPKFLGLFRGVVYEYEFFNRLTLQRDLARIERFYRARGFYDAHARAGRVIPNGAGHVLVEIVVDEGAPVRIRRIELEGVEGMPPALRAAIDRVVLRTLVPKQRFDEDVFRDSESALRRALTDNGYAFATVERTAIVDVVHRQADLVLRVDRGPRAVFGPVTIEGLSGLPEAPVRRALDIRRGDTYSTRVLDGARQAALNLGVFSAVEVVPDLDHAFEASRNGARVVPIRVRTEVSKLYRVRLGGGIEFDAVKVGVHALLGWESHNFLGGLRQYSVSLRPGLVFYPLRVNNWVAPYQLMPEVRFRNEFRQPGFLEARTNLFVRPELNVYPVLLGFNTTPQDPVTGYIEAKAGVGADRVFWKLFARLSENLQLEHPIAYRGALAPELGNVIISYPELITNLDLSDSRVRPHKGEFFGNVLQVAGGPFGGDASDISVQPDARAYVPLSRRVTLAARAALGFLFPFNYGFSVRDPRNPANLDPVARTHDLQLVFFRGFFAGGPNSDRGYPLRGIGPFQFVPGLSPAGRFAGATCSPTSLNTTCRVPVGGFTRWEASVEVRFTVTGPFSMGTFCDAADVSPEVANIRLRHLHLSCGVGGRYDTPVGPIRLDVGYRIPGLQVLGKPDPREVEPELLFGFLPVALAFGIGEAF
jgi:outer membrane protein insertion porin family/translocation and assembly module TamA